MSGCCWEIFEQEIYSDQDELDIDYLAKPDESTWPPYFVKLIVMRLCADGAIGVTDKAELNTIFERKYLEQVNIAMAADSKNRPATPLTTNPFLDAHLIGNGYSYYG